MERREFIKGGCKACMAVMAGVSIASFLESCATGRIVKTEIKDNRIIVLKSEFIPENKFVMVRASTLSYDIMLYKVSETQYNALLMQCTHYDNPVYANNREIFCPSHGSKFDFNGKVTQEPATTNLKSYKTEIGNDAITIILA